MISLGGNTFSDLCAKELELCGLKEGEVVAVLTQGDERLEYADAFLAPPSSSEPPPFTCACRASRTASAATPASGPSAPPRWRDNRPALEALKAADLVIDTMFLLFSKEQLEIQEAGARMLLCMEPIEHLVQLFPSRNLRERVEYGGELLGKASSLRFTNQHGTDVTYRMGATR